MMRLGFTVEELVPAGRGGGALRMGLMRLEPQDWLWPEFDRAARVAAFAGQPDSVVIAAGAEAAASEAAVLVAGVGDLAVAAARVWEDLCVMVPDGDAGYRLGAGAVGFPTDWRMAEKLGLGLAALHGGIHGYAEQLATGVDHFFRKLAPGAIFGRANWFIVANDDWRYMPGDDPAVRFAHVTPGNAGETLVVRCERQTLRRLPASGGVLFTIGIAVARLGTLSPGVVARLADTVAAMGAGEHARRAGPHYTAALAEYAAARGALENAA